MTEIQKWTEIPWLDGNSVVFFRSLTRALSLRKWVRVSVRNGPVAMAKFPRTCVGICGRRRRGGAAAFCAYLCGLIRLGGDLPLWPWAGPGLSRGPSGLFARGSSPGVHHDGPGLSLRGTALFWSFSLSHTVCCNLKRKGKERIIEKQEREKRQIWKINQMWH